MRRYFIQIEKKYKSGSVGTTQLSPQLQFLINLELQQKVQQEKIFELENWAQQQETELRDIKNVLVDSESDRRRWIQRSVSEIANSPSFDGIYNKFQKVWLESYKRLSQKIDCDLDGLVKEERERARKSGSSRTVVKNISKQTMIAKDPKLREVYILVIKEMLIAYATKGH